MSESIYLFYNGPFSQWHIKPFTAKSMVRSDIPEKTFNCAEQYMMAEKALTMGDEETYQKIMSVKTPRMQKALGRKVKNYSEEKWVAVREKCVYHGNLCKFTQNHDLKKKLLSTGNKIMAEASPVDKIWGIGMGATHKDAKDTSKWKGINLLGKALMAVRNELQKEDLHPSPPDKL